MLKNLEILWPFLVIFAILVIFFAVLAYFLTRKYNKKRMKFYSFFLDVRPRVALLAACAMLNFALTIYFAVRIDVYGNLATDLIVLTSIISFVSALSFGIMFLDALSVLIAIIALRLSNMIFTYFMTFQDEKMVLWLWILFTLLIIVLAAFIFFKKIEILTKKNKFVRRNSNG